MTFLTFGSSVSILWNLVYETNSTSFQLLSNNPLHCLIAPFGAPKKLSGCCWEWYLVRHYVQRKPWAVVEHKHGTKHFHRDGWKKGRHKKPQAIPWFQVLIISEKCPFHFNTALKLALQPTLSGITQLVQEFSRWCMVGTSVIGIRNAWNKG